MNYKSVFVVVAVLASFGVGHYIGRQKGTATDAQLAHAHKERDEFFGRIARSQTAYYMLRDEVGDIPAVRRMAEALMREVGPKTPDIRTMDFGPAPK